MKKSFILLIILVSISLVSCSKDDNPTESAQVSSTLKATWSDSTKVNTESLKVSLPLDESNGVISGTGRIDFLTTANNSSNSVIFENNATGTKQNSDVVIIISSGSNKFTFTGKLSSDNSTISGTVVLIIKDNLFMSDGTYNFSMNLKKK